MTEPPRTPNDAAWQALFSGFASVSPADLLARMREDLRGKDPLEALTWHSPEGLDLRPIYTRGDLPEGVQAATSGVTGPRRIRQDFSDRDPETARAQAMEALASGCDEIGFHLNLLGDGGRGIRVRRQQDFDTLLDGFESTDAAVYFFSRTSVSRLTALLLNAGERMVKGASEVKVSLELDPVGSLLRNGVCALDAEVAEVAEGIKTDGAWAGVLAVDARPFHEAGASMVQEIAFTLGVWSEYLSRFDALGLPLPQALGRGKLIVPVGTSFFPEIAKVRAYGRLLGQVFAAYGVPEEAEIRVPMTAYTSARELSVQDPHSNLLRGTTAGIAAMLGGCDTVCVLPFDGADEEPDRAGLRLARNTLLVLRHEAYLEHVANPVDGAYYVEAATDALCRKAWSLFQTVEARGGLVASLEDGFIQAQIADTRQARGAGGRGLLPVERPTRGAVATDAGAALREIEPLPAFRTADPAERGADVETTD